MYRDVSLAPDDIEWVHDNDHDGLKSIVWDDTDFHDYIALRGLEDALEAVHHFHRVIANQLIERATKDPESSDWAHRTISLCRRVKARRQELRRAYIVVYGPKALQLEVERLSDLYPRSVWGSADADPRSVR